MRTDDEASAEPAEPVENPPSLHGRPSNAEAAAGSTSRQAWRVAVAGELFLAVLVAVALVVWDAGTADQGEPELPTSRGSLPPSAAPRSATTPITFQSTCWPTYQAAPAEDITYNACAVQRGNRVAMRVFVASPTKRAMDIYVWLHNDAAKKKVEPRAACASMRLGRQPALCGDFFAGPPDAGPWQVALAVKPAGVEFSKDEWLKPETTGYLSRPFRW